MEDQTSSTSEVAQQQLLFEPEETAEVGAVAVAEGAETEKVGKPEGRVYSDDEWNKRQSAIDRQLEQTRREHATALEKTQDEYVALLRQTEEQKAADWLSRIEQEGGDVTLAKEIVVAQRQVQEQQRAFQTQERQLREQQKVVNEALKNLKAHELVKQHSLKDDTVAELLKAGDPLEMENMALKYALNVVLTKQVAPAKVASGVGQAKGVDLGSMSAHDRAMWALEQLEEHRK